MTIYFLSVNVFKECGYCYNSLLRSKISLNSVNKTMANEYTYYERPQIR